MPVLRRLAPAGLAALGLAFLTVALVLGLSRLIGPVAAFAGLGALCLGVAVLAAVPRPRPPPAGAEIATLLAVLALRALVRRR